MHLPLWILAAALLFSLSLAEEGSGLMDDLLTTTDSSLKTDETTLPEQLLSTTALPDTDLTPEASTTTEELLTTTTMDPVRKWNKKDLEDAYRKKITPCEEKIVPIEPAADEPIPPCPEGWVHFKESCYLIQKRYSTMAMADEICQGYDTTLFVADDYCELEFIQEQAIEGYTWIGVFKKDEEETKWQAGCGMDLDQLPWLIKDREYHGWNEVSRCAGMYNSADLHYTHFFPCGRSMNFICERNATLYTAV